MRVGAVRRSRRIVCALAACWLVLPLRAAEPAPALDFTLPNVFGGHWRLAESRGREVWIAVVAPWCGDCEQFVRDVRARTAQPDARGDVAVVAVVSAVDRRGTAFAFSGEPPAGVSALLVDAKGAALAALDPDELPWLVHLDADGQVRATGDDLETMTPARAEGPGWLERLTQVRTLFGAAAKEE